MHHLHLKQFVSYVRVMIFKYVEMHEPKVQYEPMTIEKYL